MALKLADLLSKHLVGWKKAQENFSLNLQSLGCACEDSREHGGNWRLAADVERSVDERGDNRQETPSRGPPRGECSITSESSAKQRKDGGSSVHSGGIQLR